VLKWGMTKTRYARINRGPDGTVEDADRVAAYLPSNYSVVGVFADQVIIAGNDNAGWTLEDYVLPRLASGLYFGVELTEAP